MLYSKGEVVPRNRAALLKTIGHNLSNWVRQPVGLSFFYPQIIKMNIYRKKVCLSLAVFLAVFLLSGCSNQTQQTTADRSKVEETAQPVLKSQEQVKDPVIETKEDIKIEPITFETTTKSDSTLAKGQTKTKQEGKNGSKELKYKITITNGQETNRELISETIVVEPVNKIVLIGTKETITGGSCGAGYYKNVDGNCIKNPGPCSAGASALCGDGTCSYSQHRQGTCSGHRGVAEWL